ncbi:EamA family transporter [Thermoproteota archaeon]
MSKQAFIFALLTALVWGLVPAIEKVGLTRVQPNVALLVRSCGVIFGAALLLLFKFNSIKAEFLDVTPRTVFFLVSGGLLASIVAQLFFYRALKFGDTSKVVAIAGTYPLVSFLLALIFLGEKFTLVKFLGIFFVLLGVVLLR